ncbi:unnamed protein product, partial [marine sediment metagenome]
MSSYQQHFLEAGNSPPKLIPKINAINKGICERSNPNSSIKTFIIGIKRTVTGILSRNPERTDAYKIDDLELLPGVIDGLKILQEEFIFFIVTNQSGIGRGYYTEDDFHNFNAHLI